MTIRSMRFLDRYAGIPLCWLAGMFHNRSVGRSRAATEIRTILVVKFFGLGSILLTTAALQIMREHFTHARITYLTFDANRGLLERLSPVDEVLTIRTSGLTAFLKDTAGTVRKLRALQPDMAFDFEFFSKFSTLLCFLSGAPVRIGFLLPARWRTRLLTHSAPLTKMKHVLHNFAEQVYTMGAPRSTSDISPPASSEEETIGVSRKLNLSGGPAIVVNVNAGRTFLERRWPAEKFSRLVNLLARDSDRVFVFIGAEDERSYVETVIRNSDHKARCINAAGRLAMGELLALFRQSSLLVSNDSGPLHLAAAVGTPTLGLFGPETPAFYGQLNHRSRIIYKRLPCSPCMNEYAAKTFRCPYDARCMRSIDVNEVHDAALDLLRSA